MVRTDPAASARPKWAELPAPSKIVIVALTAGIAGVALAACVSAATVILRAGGVIG